MAGLSLRVSIEGDKLMLERTGQAMRNCRPLLKQIGVLILGEAVHRLVGVLKMETGGVRTGRLQQSLMVSEEGMGNADNVFELSDARIVVGSNVEYAAQLHFGGPIRPVTAKALAIPLVDQLRRDEKWPRDLDPSRKILEYLPTPGGQAFAVLRDPENELGYGTAPLFALTGGVNQEGKPYLLIDDHIQMVIAEDLWPLHLGLR